MNSAPPPKRPLVQLLLLGFLLIVFPLGSFLYLQAGWNYQLDSRNEMAALGPVSELFAYPRPDSSIDIVFAAPASRSDSSAISLRDIHLAFDDNPTVRFVGLGEATEMPFEDTEQLKYFPERIASFASATSDTRFSKQCESVPLRQRAYVVDVDGQVRRCYNLHSGADAKRLVEQVALIIPRPKTTDVILERNPEL